MTDETQTDRPNMPFIRFAVPAPLYEEMLKVANSEGITPSALYRSAITLGFASYLESLNKRMIYKKIMKGLEE